MIPEFVRLSQVEAIEAQWSQLETESLQEREESRKLAALFQKVTALSLHQRHCVLFSPSDNPRVHVLVSRNMAMCSLANFTSHLLRLLKRYLRF